MEIKVTCPCGTRYKFPVEPVDGRLPQAIACPVCGADNTALGNQMIQEQLGGAAPPPPAPPAGGLRIAAHVPSAPPPAAAPPPPRPQPAMSRSVRSAPAGDGAAAKAKKIGSIIVTSVLVIIGVYAIYSKWSRRIRGMANLIEAVSTSGETSSGTKIHWTLPDDNGSVLLVKSDSQTNVAATVATAYGQLVKRPMKVVPATEALDEDGELAIWPVLKGAVHVEGPMEWPEAQATNLAATVSKQLHTVVVLAIMGDDAETGAVSIYEEGERRFYVRHWMEIKSLSEDGIKEFTQREGEAWAATHGYVPGPTNFLSGDKMAFEDVNQLVLNLGIDVSDPPEEATQALVVKPAGPPGAARPAPARK